MHMISEYAGSFGAHHGMSQQTLEIMPIENVISQHQCRRMVTNEILANQKSLCEAVG